MKFRVNCQEPDGERICLGAVEVVGISEPKAREIMEREWPKFQATDPDADSQFISWLRERFTSFRRCDDDFIDFYVEG